MASRPSQPRNRNDLKIAIVCALPLEAGMVQDVFDQKWENENTSLAKAQGDHNSYTLGVIGKHNVVLLHMPGMGNVDSAKAATSLRMTFPSVAIVFIVGICGVSPKNIAKQEDIVLGDCILSTALVQYDFGRQYPGQFSTKSDVEDVLGRPGPMVRAFLAKLQTPQTSESLEKRLALHLEVLQQKNRKASSPGRDRDRLFDATYLHTHHDSAEACEKCIREIGICTKDCDELRCQEERSVKRVMLISYKDPDKDCLPRLRFGRYGSANTVLKSGIDRDELATKHKIIAFEMEGAGFWESIPTIIIKSACDYADSHKSKAWQNYAAATAAAGLKAVLEEWKFSARSSEQDDKYDVLYSLEGLPIAKKFISRPKEMEKLENVLLPDSQSTRRKLFVLRGLGGIGKTQLAVEFMRLHHSKFSAVFWLDGSSEDSLKQNIARHACRIPYEQISEESRAYATTGQGDLDDIVAEVLKWLKLSDNDKWLVVFDNVDREFVASNPDALSFDIKKYIPSVDHGSILITTRLAQLDRLGQSKEVKKVDNQIARAILDSWYDLSYDESDTAALLERLDGLPLAIAQAGAYLEQKGVSIKTYLRLYDEQKEKVVEALFRQNTLLDDYPDRSIWTTWNISYNAIFATNKHVASLLVLWSFLDRNDLWYGLFERASNDASTAKALSENLGDATLEEMSFVDAMSLLRSYSLIEGSEHSEGYMMHTVVQKWVYFYHGTKHRSDLGLLALMVIGSAVPMSSERFYAPLQQRLLPHANMCSIRVLGAEESLRGHHSGSFAFESHISKAEFKNCLVAMHSLGDLYSDQGKLAEAEKMYMRALQGREEALGVKHTSTLNTVNNLGNLYFDQGKLDEAEKMYMRALQGYEEALGAEHTSTLNTVNNLGNLYSDQGKLDEAEKMYMRALQGKEEALGAKHTSTLDTVNNLGNLYSDQGKLDEAEKMYMRALQGYEEALGVKHTSTLDTVNNLGLLYSDQGKLDEAEKMLLRALQGYEEALGAEHTSTLNTVNNLGSLYIKQGKLDKAEKMLDRALQGYEEALAPKHLSTLDAIYNLGDLYCNQGKLDEAEKRYDQALQGYEEVLGSELVKTYIPALKTMWHLGNLYSKKRPDEAKDIYTKALAGYTTVQGASSNVCLDLAQRLDALKLTKQSNADPKLSTSSAKPDGSKEHKQEKRKGLSKLMWKVMK